MPILSKAVLISNSHLLVFLLFPGGERNLEPVCLLSEAEHGLGEAKEVGGC